MSSGKYFRVLVRGIHPKYRLKTDSFSQPIFNQHSKDELDQYKLVKLPFFYSHKIPVKISDKKDNEPVIVEYDRRMQLGMIVYKIVTNDGSMLCLIDIPPEPAPKTNTDRARIMQKDAAIAMIQKGYMTDVSFVHYNDNDYIEDLNVGRIQKLPIEMSLVKEGGRDGSKILLHYFADDPFLDEKEYKNFEFDHYGSAAKTGLDYNFFSDDEENQNQKQKMSGQQPGQNALTPDEIRAMAETLKRLEADNKKLSEEAGRNKEDAEKFRKKREEEQAAKQGEYMNNFNTLNDQLVKLLEMVNKGEVEVGEMDNETKETFKYAEKMIPEQKAAVSEGMKKFFMRDPADTTPLDPEMAREEVSRAFGNASTAVSVFSKLVALNTKRVEGLQKDKALSMQKNATASKAAAGAAEVAKTVASGLSGNKRKPDEPKFLNWEDVQANAKKFKSKLAEAHDDGDLPDDFK